MGREITNLEKRIKHEIDKYSNTCGIYADDLKGNTVEIKADEVFEAASCIKIFILIEFYRQVFEGKKKRNDILEYKESYFANGTGVIKSFSGHLELETKNVAAAMIVISDNIATNMMIDYLGLENINKTIAKLGFEKTKLLNTIHFDKYNTMGTTTPEEYARAFKKILKHELFDADLCEEMLKILKRQQGNKIFTGYFPQYDIANMGTDKSLIKYIASKSGGLSGANLTPKTKNLRACGGVISTRYGEYVISIFVSDFKDPYYYDDNINDTCGARVSQLIFDAFVTLEGKFNHVFL